MMGSIAPPMEEQVGHAPTASEFFNDVKFKTNSEALHTCIGSVWQCNGFTTPTNGGAN